MDEQSVRIVETDALRIAYVEHGPTHGWPVILPHSDGVIYNGARIGLDGYRAWVEFNLSP
jgi:hypothetical protein